MENLFPPVKNCFSSIRFLNSYLMQDEIGLTAGQVWEFLDGRGETSSLQIRSSLKITQTMVFLALGWLEREGKISLLYRDRCYWVSLRQ